MSGEELVILMAEDDDMSPDLIHELAVLGEHVVNSAPCPSFLPAVEPDHFQPGPVQVDRRSATEISDRHKIGSLLDPAETGLPIPE